MRIRCFAAVLSAAIGLLAGTPAMAQTLEEAVLVRINFARQHPQEYAEQLRAYRAYFTGRILYLPGDVNGIITREGPSAVDEAIAFLEQQIPLPPLDAGTVLALAAADHAEAQGRAGSRGHVSPDGSTPGERVRRHGGDIYVGESISYGMHDPDAVVRQMIVDDGIPDRGHRKLLFDRSFHYAGVGCGAHRAYGALCVVDLAGTSDGRPDMTRYATAAR